MIVGVSPKCCLAGLKMADCCPEVPMSHFFVFEIYNNMHSFLTFSVCQMPYKASDRFPGSTSLKKEHFFTSVVFVMLVLIRQPFQANIPEFAFFLQPRRFRNEG